MSSLMLHATLATAAVLAGAAWLVRGRMTRFRIVNRSMLPTLQPGDRLLVNLHAYRRRVPRRSDLVLFRHPETPGLVAIKRLVGLPGEHVTLRPGTLISNGLPLSQPSADNLVDPPEFEWHLKSGQYLVLGDNRLESRDSRHFGPLTAGALIGKAWYRYAPPERRGPLPSRV